MGSSPLSDALQAVDFDDEIELVGFDATGARSFYTGGGSFGIGWSRLLEAEDRSRLRALLSALPSGQFASWCHEPPFGLLFGTRPRETHVSICFKCDNLYVEEELVVFDAGSSQAQELLAFLRSRMPKDWVSDE